MDDTSQEFQTLFDKMSAFVTECMSGHDPSHNPAHVHRVVALANKILEAERALHPTTEYNGALVKLAALLHDIGDRKYLSKVDAAPGSKELDPTTMVQHALLARGATPELASQVQTIVSNVSYSSECKDPALVRRLIDDGLVELAIVQDADRLDAIGAIGVGRCFTFLGAVGKKYCVDGKWEMDNAIQHFGDKLVKLQGMMKTATGKEMARVRTERLEIFAGWWEEEMNHILPRQQPGQCTHLIRLRSTPPSTEQQSIQPTTATMADAQFDSALDLLRRLNPRNTKKNLQAITSIVPDLTEDLLASVDQPLEVRRCPQTNRDYLLCDYNRDGDSYRSPWSNEFDPPLEDGTVPSERVRKLELAANESFDVYRELYYEGGVGSVYFWDLDDGFAGVILLKKGVTPGSQSSGEWDSIHVFEATDRARMSHYKLTSTVILHLANTSEALGDMDLSGNMTRQVEVDLPVESDASHVANEVYFGKAKDVVGELRSIGPLSDANRDRETQREMIMSMQK
ncbi:WASH complex F-actin capping protein beta subunit [Penicillium sp. DV-2018c]|nr:WASH complex F-actin capping protein beta subunit [Penicillium sp. DV-2018c]KAJ5571542.1 WASH complex F-actin capping protein beta subunit [Penicillium sp. DV-2018c]